MKTRAFDPETKQWRTDYVVMPDGSLWRYEFSVFSGNHLVEKVNWKLSRFTGLLDMNGKEIYEGDIVKHWMGVSEVYYDLGMAAFNVKDYYDQSADYPTVAFSEGVFEVIGDVFLNPELLEV